MARVVEKDAKMVIGRLFSTGMDYDNAQKEFLTGISTSDMQKTFEEVWNDYEHMYFANLPLFKTNV
jgi:hypothetical protein